MNYTRVLLAGLAAGVVINLGEFLMYGVVMADAMGAAMAGAGLTEASWAMWGYVLSGFILGIVLAWLYAAIRPRYGAGWKTAIVAALALWVAAYFVPSLWMGAMGLGMGTGLTLTGYVWGVIELSLAGVVAGWLYREPETPRAAASAAF